MALHFSRERNSLAVRMLICAGRAISVQTWRGEGAFDGETICGLQAKLSTRLTPKAILAWFSSDRTAHWGCFGHQNHHSRRAVPAQDLLGMFADRLHSSLPECSRDFDVFRHILKEGSRPFLVRLTRIQKKAAPAEILHLRFTAGNVSPQLTTFAASKNS